MYSVTLLESLLLVNFRSGGICLTCRYRRLFRELPLGLLLLDAIECSGKLRGQVRIADQVVESGIGSGMCNGWLRLRFNDDHEVAVASTRYSPRKTTVMISKVDSSMVG